MTESEQDCYDDDCGVSVILSIKPKPVIENDISEAPSMKIVLWPHLSTTLPTKSAVKVYPMAKAEKIKPVHDELTYLSSRKVGRKGLTSP